MAQDRRVVLYDQDLKLEAYLFQGVMQAFPSHFHDYYFIGFLEQGLQEATCKDFVCQTGPGSLLLFNPGDVHACRPVDDRPLDYRCLNVPVETMERAMREITGSPALPRFTSNLVPDAEQVPALRALHTLIMEEAQDFDKEETFLLLLGQLLTDYAGEPLTPPASGGPEVDAVRDYLSRYYDRRVVLDDLSALTGWSKYRLIRAFTREMGITPYSYLVTVRVGEAKKRLEAGATPLEAALSCGFADQSHFSNHFKRLIGLTPRQYANIFTKEEPRRA